MNEQVTAYIEAAPPEHQEIMIMIRRLIHDMLPTVTEAFKWSRPIFTTTKDFAYLLSSKNYVTLGFTKDIDKLDDPNHILEGTGKTMRHIKLRHASDINTSLIKDWMTCITSDS